MIEMNVVADNRAATDVEAPRGWMRRRSGAAPRGVRADGACRAACRVDLEIRPLSTEINAVAIEHNKRYPAWSEGNS
jgi:hypothetical protein